MFRTIILSNQLFSLSSDKDRRTDSRIRRNNSAAPPGIEPRILRILVARSNHWATKPQRELRVIFSTFTKLSVLFPLRGEKKNWLLGESRKITRSSRCGFVAQWLERATRIRKILGSIPGGAALCFFVWSGCQFFYLCRSWERKVD